MKRPIFTLLAIFLCMASISNVPASANPPKFTLPSSIIDGVSVPYEILLDIQGQHQGFAVTKASKIRRGGEWLYRLRVDHDDIPNDYESFYLLYDQEWNFVSREDMHAPPPEEPAEPEEEPEDKPQEEESAHEQDNNESDGGHGGGEEGDSEQSTDTGSGGGEEGDTSGDTSTTGETTEP